MKFAILLTGHIRNSLEYDNLFRIIKEIKKKGECDIYGFIPNKKEHSTLTWYKQDTNLQKEYVNYEQLNDMLKFKKLVIYEEQEYTEDTKKILWAKSPLSFVGVKSLYNNIFNCLNLIENNEYDLIFRLRFDYYKFDYAKYTDSIVYFIQTMVFNKNSITCIKVKGQRGEDSFIVSDKERFFKAFTYIIYNFNEIENYAKFVNYYFMPEDIIKYACIKQNININILGD
jgi:hypothetical protein